MSSALLSEADECLGPSHLLHPSTLNRAVENAIGVSTLASKDPMAANVGFVVADLEGEDEEGLV